MSEEIKPCPFCGSDAEYDDFTEAVTCVNKTCNSYGPDGKNDYDAIQKWNQRPYDYDMPAIVKKVRQLEEQNKELQKELDYYRSYSSLLEEME